MVEALFVHECLAPVWSASELLAEQKPKIFSISALFLMFYTVIYWLNKHLSSSWPDRLLFLMLRKKAANSNKTGTAQVGAALRLGIFWKTLRK